MTTSGSGSKPLSCGDGESAKMTTSCQPRSLSSKESVSQLLGPLVPTKMLYSEAVTKSVNVIRKRPGIKESVSGKNIS